jgi:hypothetical protein
MFLALNSRKGWLELRVNNYDPIYFAPNRDVIYLNGYHTGVRFFNHHYYTWRLRQAQHQEHWKPKIRCSALQCHAAVLPPYNIPNSPGLILSRYLFLILKDMRALEILCIIWYEEYMDHWPKKTWQDRFKESCTRECGAPWRNNFIVIVLTEKALRTGFSEVGHYCPT